MDTLEIRIRSELYVNWPEGGGFQQIEMLINGIPLIEIIRELELPHAEQEFDVRVAEGETEKQLGLRGSLAGAYMYLPPVIALPPSRNFFGEPYKHGFLTEPDDPVNQKSLILQCTCSITNCWFLLANTCVNDDTVTWNNFQQFHRDWTYNELSFTFDRKQYEVAFNTVKKPNPHRPPRSY